MPEHLDFIKHLGVNLHSLSCEFALISDNLARLAGTSVPDSLTIAHHLLEVLKCSLF